MEREVIVVGAGPTGATAAISLAQRGRDVLLLDRQEFPRDKACGDGIPAAVFEKLYELGMKEKIEKAGFYPVHRLSIVSPKGARLEADLEKGPQGAASCVVPRAVFDRLIQQHAVESGVEFVKAQVKEPLLEEGRVVGVRARLNGAAQDIRSRIVIAADGVTSVIVRALRQKKHEDKHRAVALRAYIEDIEERAHEVEFYLYHDILPGYAWIFPLGENKANIGLGMRLDRFRRKKESLEEMLRAFLAMPAIKERLKQGGQLRDVAIWQLNFGSQKNLQHAFDGALLTGDAAGFINPLTGGGIHNGIISATLAAEVADEALRKGDVSRQTLSLYEQRCHEEMWRGMKRSHWIQRLLLNVPSVVDLLVRVIGSNNELVRTFVQKL